RPAASAWFRRALHTSLSTTLTLGARGRPAIHKSSRSPRPSDVYIRDATFAGAITPARSIADVTWARRIRKTPPANAPTSAPSTPSAPYGKSPTSPQATRAQFNRSAEKAGLATRRRLGPAIQRHRKEIRQRQEKRLTLDGSRAHDALRDPQR